MSDDEDFFVEDESAEELKATWRDGEPGRTKGTRDLNQRAMSIVERAVARFEMEEALPAGGVVLQGNFISTPTTENLGVVSRAG